MLARLNRCLAMACARRLVTDAVRADPTAVPGLAELFREMRRLACLVCRTRKHR